VDLNYVLMWIVGISAGAGMLSILWRFRGRQWGWLVVCALTLLTLGVGLLRFPERAGYAAAVAWATLFLVPLWGQRWLQRLAVRQRYRTARRLARVLAWLHPADGWREQPDFLEVLEELQRGNLDRARSHLDSLSLRAGPLARFARLQLFRFEGRWFEARTWIEKNVADRERTSDPQTFLFYLRVLGEVGQPAAMLQAYREAAARPSVQQARTDLLLLLFAFAGRGAALATLLAGPQRHLPEPARRFWRATAMQVAGRQDEAREQLAGLLEGADPLLRSASERRLELPLPTLDPAELPPELLSLLNNLESAVADQASYGTLARPRPGRNWVSWTLLAVLTAVFAAEVPGGTTSSENLARLGALLISPGVPVAWWRVFTAAFLHFGAVHFALNALALWYLGRYLERLWGAAAMAAAFVIPAVSANTVAVMLLSGPRVALVGASGGVMGVIGALMVLMALEWRRTGVLLLRRQLWLLGTIVAVQVLFDLVTPRVSSTIHVAGLVVGGAVGLVFAQVRRPRRDQPMVSPPK
jgi:rhomboid protease GluP